MRCSRRRSSPRYRPPISGKLPPRVSRPRCVRWSLKRRSRTRAAVLPRIQSLIAAISTAKDQKGILDLQARIGAELGMLQNEQTKLQVLAQASEAMAAVNAQQEREQAIVGQGQFQHPLRAGALSHGFLRHILELAQRAARHLYRRQHGEPRLRPRTRCSDPRNALRDGVGATCT